MKITTSRPLLVCVLLLVGCEASKIERVDRDIYSLIEDRQIAALSEIHDARLGLEKGESPVAESMYLFSPHPLPAEVPEAFRKPTSSEKAPEAPQNEQADAEESAEDSEEKELTASIFSEAQLSQAIVLDLQGVMSYAMLHARDLQSAKEDLFLAALELTLERHLWTPQFSAAVQATFDRLEDDAPLDRALTTVSEVAVSQRLPLGGDVTARVIHSLVRDVSELVEKGETGQVILSAQIPLLRGAGRVAYESRYRAEREMIYAVRRYERFRRSFLVGIAADYFNLQQTKARIGNTFKSYLSRQLLSEKADFVRLKGRSDDIRDAPRAKANLRVAEANLVSDKERYETALDRFKIRLGMAVDAFLEVVDQDKDEGTKAVDGLLPDVNIHDAVQTAVRFRLDLLNSLDRLDDSRRAVAIAKNTTLPDLDLTGQLIANSAADQLRPTNFRDERVSWQGGIQLRIDDRKTERTAYRASLVALRRAQRDHDEFTDSVRADARRALRRVAQQDNLRRIQEFNMKENAFRLAGAQAQVELGRADNQDVVDAENDLLAAQNNLATAVADYRIAILELRRDTGTLRITDDGLWDNAEKGP